MRMKRPILLLAILQLSMVLWSEANDAYSSVSESFGLDSHAGQNSFLSLIVPGGGKYEGMATAHSAVALDGGYLESNPAAGSFLPSTTLSFAHIDWIADSALETISYTFRPESNENIGLGFSTKFFHIPFTGYNDWGSPYNRYDRAAVGWYTEMIATSGFSYNFLRSFYFGGISVGTAFKVGYRGVSASLEPNQSAISLMGDFGIMTQFNFLKTYAARDMNWGAGLVLKNLGAEFIENADPLPTYVSAGLSYKPLRPLTLALDFNFPFNLDSKAAEKLGIALGVNAEISSFLSAHTGVLLKTGKPRFALGADINLKNFTVQTNYTLDLSSRLELFDRVSIAIKIDLDTVRQFIVRDDAQELYLKGLEFYAEGNLETAAEYFKNSLLIDPTFTPAEEMLQRVNISLELDAELRKTLFQ